jgi:hypothetical protein
MFVLLFLTPFLSDIVNYAADTEAFGIRSLNS